MQGVLEPAFRASQRNAIFTGNMRNNVQPKHASGIVRTLPVLTNATLRVSRIHPTKCFMRKGGLARKFNENIPISFPTTAERTTVPTLVSRRFRSVRMRQRTGKAVTEDPTPVNNMKSNNMKSVKTISGLINSLYTACGIPAPIPKGKIIPAMVTVADRRAFRLVNFETDEKEEEAQPNVGDETEIRARGQREYVICET
jgi:hypothetical protein